MLSGFSFELIISYKQSALNHEPLTINLSSISHHTSAISLLYYSMENTKMLHATLAAFLLGFLLNEFDRL